LDISLIRRDGLILSHILNVKELLNGKNQISPDTMRRITNAESGLHFIGGLSTRASFDEMLFFELSPVLPIGMSVAVSREEILSAWKQQSINFAILGGSMSSLLIILTLFLARLIKQLEQTRNAALGAAEAKTRFITTISHELRTPMNAIVGGAHQLRSAELKPDDKHFLQIVSLLRSSSTFCSMIFWISPILTHANFALNSGLSIRVHWRKMRWIWHASLRRTPSLN
jgi:signal transduction histidine kinase